MTHIKEMTLCPNVIHIKIQQKGNVASEEVTKGDHIQQYQEVITAPRV